MAPCPPISTRISPAWHSRFSLKVQSVAPHDATIDCVLHGARFDVRDGRALCAPAYEPVVRFPVKVEDGVVWTRDDR